MEGYMHEHGPLYTSVLFVMFDEGWWVVCGVVRGREDVSVWCAVVWLVCVLVRVWV